MVACHAAAIAVGFLLAAAAGDGPAGPSATSGPPASKPVGPAPAAAASAAAPATADPPTGTAAGPTTSTATGQAVASPALASEPPVFAERGFGKPSMVEPQCVARGLRVPRDLNDGLPETITVKFAIRRDGLPAALEVVGAALDDRVTQAIWLAVSACQWVAGTDPKGQPVPMWVILPLRFVRSEPQRPERPPAGPEGTGGR